MCAYSQQIKMEKEAKYLTLLGSRKYGMITMLNYVKQISK